MEIFCIKDSKIDNKNVDPEKFGSIKKSFIYSTYDRKEI